MKIGEPDWEVTAFDKDGQMHVYRGVAPTTNRGTTTDYHGEPIKLTGQTASEPATAVYLTATEIRVLRMALTRCPLYTPKYIAVREALLLTLDKVAHATQSKS